MTDSYSLTDNSWSDSRFQRISPRTPQLFNSPPPILILILPNHRPPLPKIDSLTTAMTTQEWVSDFDNKIIPVQRYINIYLQNLPSLPWSVTEILIIYLSLTSITSENLNNVRSDS